jgi:small subunit ribosomal protein S2
VKTNTKKELLMASKALAKLTRIYGTVRHLKALPDALVIVDIKKEEKVVFEAMKTGVKTVGLVDTNCDPTPIDITVPTNDDAAGALRLVLDYFGSAVAEGRNVFQKIDVAK